VCNCACANPIRESHARISSALALNLHFWRRFHKACWKPAKNAASPKQVADPALRLWSYIKTSCGRLFVRPPRKPGTDAIHQVFVKYDRNCNVRRHGAGTRQRGRRA